MEYRDAVQKVINTYGKDIIDNHFCFYNIVSDYVGSSIYSKSLASLSFKINKILDLRSIVLNNSVEEANDYLSKCYCEGDYECSFEEFKRAIVPLVEALRPNEGLTIESSKDIDTNDSISVTIHRSKRRNIDSKETDNASKEAKKQDLRFNKIMVTANCQKLTIIANKSKTFDISKENTNGNLNGVDYQIGKHNNLNVNISDLEGSYILSIPDKQYMSFDINQTQGDLFISGNDLDELKCKKIKINSENGEVAINVKTDSCKVSGNNGNVKVNGSYGNLEIKKYRANVYGNIRFVSNEPSYNFTCNVTYGSIYVYIKDFPSRIGRVLFIKRKSYFGGKMISNKYLSCYVWTVEGEIDIHHS